MNRSWVFDVHEEEEEKELDSFYGSDIHRVNTICVCFLSTVQYVKQQLFFLLYSLVYPSFLLCTYSHSSTNTVVRTVGRLTAK